MIDQGGGNGDGKNSGLNKFAQTSPNLIFGLLQQMQALGLSLPEILAQLGVEQKDGKLSLSTNGGEKEQVEPARKEPPKTITQKPVKRDGPSGEVE
jgi:hypothetical protein